MTPELKTVHGWTLVRNEGEFLDFDNKHDLYFWDKYPSFPCFLRVFEMNFNQSHIEKISPRELRDMLAALEGKE